MLSAELFRKIRQIELYTRHLVTHSLGGEYHSVFKGRGMEFDEVRPYQAGDEIRFIDWNVTARTGEPYIKRYIEERELTVMLLVDASASADFGTVNRFKRELAAELAAVLAFSATSNNDRVGLIVFSDRIELFVPPRKGRKHVLRLVRELLTVQPKSSRTNLKLALDTLNHVQKHKSIAFLISDFYDDLEKVRPTLTIANKRHDLIALDLHDPLEEAIPSLGLLALEDAETGEVVWVDSADPHWRDWFRKNNQTRQQMCQALFRRAQIDRISVTTRADYLPALTQFFQRRAERQK